MSIIPSKLYKVSLLSFSQLEIYNILYFNSFFWICIYILFNLYNYLVKEISQSHPFQTIFLLILSIYRYGRKGGRALSPFLSPFLILKNKQIIKFVLSKLSCDNKLIYER